MHFELTIIHLIWFFFVLIEREGQHITRINGLYQDIDRIQTLIILNKPQIIV